MTKKTNTHGTDTTVGELPHSEVLEKLSAKIRKGNPQLMELKEGCKVFCPKYGKAEFRVLTCGEGMCVLSPIISHDNMLLHGQTINVPKSECEIIGCPIHLEHVMNALEGVGEINGHDVQAITMDVRSKEIHIVLYGGIGIFIDYNTSKDFAQQTPEAHEKLLEALDNNN